MHLLSNAQLKHMLTQQQYQYLLHKLQENYDILFQRMTTTQHVTTIQAVDISLTEAERHVEKWRLIDCIDHGKYNLAGKCACGKPLRYEFIIEHIDTKKRIHYGRDHFAQFLNMPPRHLKTLHEANEVLKQNILEMVTALASPNDHMRYYLQIILDAEQYNAAHPETPLHIPYDAKQQLAVGLPLLKIQQHMLDETATRLQNAQRIEQMKQLAHTYTPVAPVVNNTSSLTKAAPPPLTLPDANFPLRAQVIILLSDGIESALMMAHLLHDQSCDVLDAFSIYDLRRPAIYGKVVSILMDLEADGIVTLAHSTIKQHLDCMARFV